MSVTRNIQNLAYGFNNSLQSLSPLPIFAKRGPTSSDTAELGTYWYYETSPAAEIFVLTSSGTWTQLAVNSGSPVFDSLTVNGATVLNGALNVNSGSAAINIGTDAVAKTITIGNVTGSTAVNINTGTGGSTITTTNGVFAVATGTGAINIGTDAVAKTITIGNTTGATGLVFNAGTGLSKFNTGIATAPANSSVATGLITTSLTPGTSEQNTTGYDLLINISVAVTSATTATLTLGVGAATGPTANTVVQSFSTASAYIICFSAIVPNNYYYVMNSTGTITIASVQAQACPL